MYRRYMKKRERQQRDSGRECSSVSKGRSKGSTLNLKISSLLSKEEFDDLKFHFGTSRRGGTRNLAYAVTEQRENVDRSRFDQSGLTPCRCVKKRGRQPRDSGKGWRKGDSQLQSWRVELRSSDFVHHSFEISLMQAYLTDSTY